MNNKPLDTVEKRSKRKEFWVRCIYIYVLMFFFGLSMNVKTTVLPLVKNYYNLSDTLQGVLVATVGVGYCLNIICGLFYIQYFGIYNTVHIGSACLFIGSILTSFSVNIGMTFATLIIMGFSFGLFEVSSNCMQNSIFLENPAIFFTTAQFFNGLGSICGPYLTKLMIYLVDSDFKSVYYFIAAVAVILFIYSVILQNSNYPIVDSEEMGDIRPAFKNKFVWLFSVTLGLLVFVEQGTTDWSVIYLVDVLHYDAKKECIVFSTVYFALFTVSRLFSGFAIEKVGYYRSMIIILITELIIIIVGLVVGKYGLYVLPVSGIFIGLNWPTLFSIAIKLFKEDAPQFTSVIILVGVLLSNVCQLLIGLINDNVGSEWGYRFIALSAFLALLMVCLIYKLTRGISDGKKEAPVAANVDDSIVVNVEPQADSNEKNLLDVEAKSPIACVET